MLKRKERVSAEAHARYVKAWRIIRDKLKRSIFVGAPYHLNSALWRHVSEAHEEQFAAFSIQQIEGMIVAALGICLEREDELTDRQMTFARMALETLVVDSDRSIPEDVAWGMQKSGTDWLIVEADFAAWILSGVRVI